VRCLRAEYDAGGAARGVAAGGRPPVDKKSRAADFQSQVQVLNLVTGQTVPAGNSWRREIVRAATAFETLAPLPPQLAARRQRAPISLPRRTEACPELANQRICDVRFFPCFPALDTPPDSVTWTRPLLLFAGHSGFVVRDMTAGTGAAAPRGGGRCTGAGGGRPQQARRHSRRRRLRTRTEECPGGGCRMARRWNAVLREEGRVSLRTAGGREPAPVRPRCGGGAAARLSLDGDGERAGRRRILLRGRRKVTRFSLPPARRRCLAPPAAAPRPGRTGVKPLQRRDVMTARVEERSSCGGGTRKGETAVTAAGPRAAAVCAN
jgi:hypothetical protein